MEKSCSARVSVVFLQRLKISIPPLVWAPNPQTVPLIPRKPPALETMFFSVVAPYPNLPLAYPLKARNIVDLPLCRPFRPPE